MLAIVAGCAGGNGDNTAAPRPTTGITSATTGPSQPTTVAEPSVLMTAMPVGAARICTRRGLLGPACPGQVPESRYGLAGRPVGFGGPYAEGGYAVCLERKEGGCTAEAFHLEGGVPTGNPRADRPPRFVHAALYAARRPLDRYFPFELPCTGPVERDRLDRLLTGARKTAACLGNETIAGRRGTLALAPPYPAGGEAGGHLFFLWREGRIARAATLHAWAPVTETVDVLRRVVASAPAQEP
jgi:hypothetical protein